VTGGVVVVTGAASGIGRAAALRFAGEGARVVVADLAAEAAGAVVEEIQAAGGVAVAAAGDVSEPTVVDQIVRTAVDTFGGLDVLVNNAGVMDRMSATVDVTDDEWERVIRINLTAPFRLTRAALPHMLAKGKGAVVNVASEAALRGSAAGTAYTVSKHGIVGLTRSVALMYRNAGIRANAIAPGGTRTNITASAVVDPAAYGPATLGAYLPLSGRVSEADEQAAAIVFLASDAASNISGVVLPVDNGWSVA
jgi:NAD(P)-dependent dehydrogenase (short-subunit alcohol dehydrogenase family)